MSKRTGMLAFMRLIIYVVTCDSLLLELPRFGMIKAASLIYIDDLPIVYLTALSIVLRLLLYIPWQQLRAKFPRLTPIVLTVPNTLV